MSVLIFIISVDNECEWRGSYPPKVGYERGEKLGTMEPLEMEGEQLKQKRI